MSNSNSNIFTDITDKYETICPVSPPPDHLLASGGHQPVNITKGLKALLCEWPFLNVLWLMTFHFHNLFIYTQKSFSVKMTQME